MKTDKQVQGKPNRPRMNSEEDFSFRVKEKNLSMCKKVHTQ